MNQANKMFLKCLFTFALLLLPHWSFALNLIDTDELLGPNSSKTISMDFKNAPLNDVLKIFSQQSGLNFISSTEISDKTINLYLDQVPIEEALERILIANGLTYELKEGSNIFVVKTLNAPAFQLMTRVYPLKYASVNSAKINSTIAIEEEATSSSSSSEEDDEDDKGIKGAIEKIITDKGSVMEDKRTNSLIVSDIPSQFPLIEQTIARLDIKVPQILIEVEMLDVSKTMGEKIGLKWGQTPFSLQGATKHYIFPFDTNAKLDQGYTFEDPEYTSGQVSFAGLQATLDFLRTATDTRNLAHPRILTLNNETAEIEIKTDEAIGLAASTTSTEGTGTTVAQAERVETGVFLKVTPQANVETKEITMAIEPRVIQARAGGTFGTEDVNQQTFRDPEERGSKSILRIRDGNTVIIGGLLRTDSTATQVKVPILGDIPIIKKAFTHNDKQDIERELIIFLTPHIVSDEVPTMAVTSTPSKKLLREQQLPEQKENEINKYLSLYEK